MPVFRSTQQVLRVRGFAKGPINREEFNYESHYGGGSQSIHRAARVEGLIDGERDLISGWNYEFLDVIAGISEEMPTRRRAYARVSMARTRT